MTQMHMTTIPPEPPEPDWRSRLCEMENWYRDFSADLQLAAKSLNQEYAPFVSVLSTFQGTVLDVGGGAGISGAFLETGCDYVVLEPSPTWLDERWSAIANLINPARTRPRFALGVGERLPFSPGTFDSAMALWSLNHAEDPAAVLQEMHRVMRPGGSALIVLEDAVPLISDDFYQYLKWVGHHLGLRGGTHANPRKPSGLLRTLGHKIGGRPWPTQSDHISISEPQFKAWIENRFIIIRRSWESGYLSYELRRSA